MIASWGQEPLNCTRFVVATLGDAIRIMNNIGGVREVIIMEPMRGRRVIGERGNLEIVHWRKAKKLKRKEGR